MKSQYEMLNLTFNAQGSKIIIVLVHVGAMKISIDGFFSHIGTSKLYAKIKRNPLSSTILITQKNHVNFH